MSKYVISSDISGTTEMPFQLEPDTSASSQTSAVTSIDLNGCAVYMGNNEGDFNSFFISDSNANYLSSLQSITNGSIMNEKCGYMFADCGRLTSFSANLPNIIDGENMFAECSALTSFSIDLSYLTNGPRMFDGCSELTSFSADLSSLIDGESMFLNCSELQSFNTDLSSLTACNYMFEGCSNLTSFNADLRSLEECQLMFDGCSNLTSFESTMNSLKDCNGMFYDCTALTRVLIRTTNEVYNMEILTKTNLGITTKGTFQLLIEGGSDDPIDIPD